MVCYLMIIANWKAEWWMVQLIIIQLYIKKYINKWKLIKTIFYRLIRKINKKNKKKNKSWLQKINKILWILHLV